VVRLEDNYRCTTEIIAVANRLVSRNRGRHEKTLVAHKTGPAVLFKPYPDEQTEAEGVVREIGYQIQQLQTSPGDIAILFRTNEQPRLFESELRRLRVPYVLVGGQSFFDRREVRDLLAYLKVLAHPDDEVSLLRIINVPARGIGDASVERLIARAVKAGQSLWDIVPDAVAAREISAKTAASIHKFRELLESYRRRLATPGVHLGEVVQQLVAQIDYDSEIQKQYKEVAMQLARSGVVDEFLTAVREYEKRALRPSLAEFLEETALAGKEDAFGDDPEQERSGVRLMTLHSAKGLEFPRVYLVGLEEGLLPHQRSVDADADSAIEEERRLAYVGITRARDVLTVSWAQTRIKWGKRRETICSRFVTEMQPENDGAAGA
jgi:DNA helicase-2/ATP-dependent DNA helicase PcrA